MKPLTKVLAAVSYLAVSLDATAAYRDTSYFNIARIDAAPNLGGGFRIYPQNYALPNVDGCAASDYAVISTAVWQAEQADMVSFVLSAFLTGKKVQLGLDGCGKEGRPAYRVVRVDVTR